MLMSALPHVLVLNGPNLNFLGRREPQIYGHTTLTDVIDELRRRYDGTLVIDHLQSNHEGVLIDRLQAVADEPNLLGVVLNCRRLHPHFGGAARCREQHCPAAGGGGAPVECAGARGLQTSLTHRRGVSGRHRGIRHRQLSTRRGGAEKKVNG